MTLRHRIRFYQQLAVLVRAGVPIRASLVRLSEKLALREVRTLSDRVNAGEKLDEAFTAAGFSSFECNLVTAGERIGQLDTIFDHLADFWKRELEMEQALIRPLYYPIAVLHFTVLIGAVVEATTTPLTLVLFHFVLTMALLYVAGAGIYFAVRFSWSNELWQRFWLGVPIIGSALRTTYSYRWITVMNLEFTAGISLARAVGDAWRASGYVGNERFAEEGEQEMRSGVELSKLVQRWKRLPRDWIDFIETGEISGALEASFKNLEAEAARAWTLAQQRMTEWVPKIVYFVVLLIVAVQVGMTMYKVIIAPITAAESQIDQATGGN